MEMLNEGEGGEPLDPERSGLARELARMNLSLAFYTQWYWKTNLHNLMHFLSLRADAHAQYEIRVYADAMIDTLKRWCPICARRLPGIPHGRRASLQDRPCRREAHDRGREGRPEVERPQSARMARADGGARIQGDFGSIVWPPTHSQRPSVQVKTESA